MLTEPFLLSLDIVILAINVYHKKPIGTVSYTHYCSLSLPRFGFAPYVIVKASPYYQRRRRKVNRILLLLQEMLIYFSFELRRRQVSVSFGASALIPTVGLLIAWQRQASPAMKRTRQHVFVLLLLSLLPDDSCPIVSSGVNERKSAYHRQ